MKLPKLVWKKEWTTPALFIGGIVLGAIVTVGTAYALRPDLFSPKSEVPVVKAPDYVPPGPIDPPNPQPAQPEAPAALPSDETKAELNIAWYTPVKMLSKDVITDAVHAALQDQEVYDTLLQISQTIDETSGMWDLGTVKGGPYDGARYIYWATNRCDMGGCGTARFLISRDKKQAFLLNEDISAYNYPDLIAPASFMTRVPNVSIPAIAEPPETLTLTNGEVLKRNRGFSWNRDGISYIDVLNNRVKGLKKIGTSAEGYELYTAENTYGCIFIFGKDSVSYSYRSDIPRKGEGADINPYSELNIQWNQPSENNPGYINGGMNGCGIGNCPVIATAEEVGGIDTLVAVAKTSDGDLIYAPKDPASNPIVKTSYDTWVSFNTSKPTIQAFVAERPFPVIFWKDAFGRWVRYLRTDTLPPVECGKPVIYLYPEKTTDVSVRLPSFIDVTVSDPSYPAEGWKVTAQPDGKLTDKRDGKQYGSLYWEGTGVGYETPKDGWIVKDGEVETFLADILPRYGLNETEAREFMEFWVPEMKGAPYYRVSFLTSAWNKAAPLYVSPRPQSVIRIFMDWRPVSALTQISAPVIEPTVRDGFTLVEWGGTLYR